MLEALAMNPLRMVVEASCGETAKHMSDYVEGGLSGFRHRRLARHLARCERCQAVLRSLRQALATLGRLGEAELASDPLFADRVVDRIRGEG
jgi:anti-sigma factor RsiW